MISQINSNSIRLGNFNIKVNVNIKKLPPFGEKGGPFTTTMMKMYILKMNFGI